MPREWFDRCVEGVARHGGARNPRAVCGAVLREKRRKAAMKKRKHGKKKRHHHKLSAREAAAKKKLQKNLRGFKPKH